MSITGTNDLRFSKNGKCIAIQAHEQARRDVISQSDHSNVLILSAPYRYDIREAIYYIDKYNDNLERLVNEEEKQLAFPQRLRCIEINKHLNRECYSYHGLHLNAKGKHGLSRLIEYELHFFPTGIDAPQIW